MIDKTRRLEELIDERTPFKQYQYVDVTFDAADSDTTIPHDLLPPTHEQIDYRIVRINGPAVVYHDESPTRKPWGKGFIILRCSLSGATATLLLTVSPDDRLLPLETGPVMALGGIPATVFSDWVYPGTADFDGGHIHAETVTANSIAALTITGDKIAANTIAAGKLVAHTITSNEIAALTITAAEIAASTITGAKIAAFTIEGSNIAAGTISADKLLIGITANWFTNSEFRMGLADGGGTWAVGYGTDTCTWNIGVHYADAWTLKDSGTGYLYTTETPGVGTYRLAWGPMFPAQAGKYYELSGYLGNHRNQSVRVELHFFNSAGSDIGAIYGNGIGQDKSGGQYLSGYGRSYVVGVAPDNTVQIQPYLRATSSNEANPYLFYTRLLLAEAHANQTLPSEWSGVTQITGDSIVTGTITAGKIAAGTITADRLVLTASGAAINEDPSLLDSTCWALQDGNGSIVTVTDGKVGNKAWQNQSSNYCLPFNSRLYPLDLNKTYRIHCWARTVSGTTGTFYLCVQLCDKDGQNITGDGTYWYYPAAGVVPGATWEEYVGIFGFDTSKTFPSNARFFRPGVILNYTAGDRIMQVQDLRIIEAGLGRAWIDSVLSLGTDGGIYQGTGTFGSPSTGLKIWNDGTIGRIAGYNNGTLQWGAETSGYLVAGAGSVKLNAEGIRLIPGLSGSYDSNLQWEKTHPEIDGYIAVAAQDLDGGNYRALSLYCGVFPSSPYSGTGDIEFLAGGNLGGGAAKYARIRIICNSGAPQIRMGDETVGADPIYFYPITGSPYATFTGTSSTISIGPQDFYIQPCAGAWARGYYFKGSSGTTLGGFGAYGSSDSLTYFWIGPAYDSPYFALDGSGITLYKGVGINPQAGANALWVHAVTGQWAGVFDNFQTASYGLLLRAGTLASWEPALQVMAKDASTSLFNVYPAGTVVYNTLHFGADIDTNLYRGAANRLQTDDSLCIGDTLYFGSGVDTNLYRSAANVLKTDDVFYSASTYGFAIGSLSSAPRIQYASSTFSFLTAADTYAALVGANCVFYNIEPGADNSYDLGTSSKRWQDLYLSGALYLDNHLLPPTSATYDLGSSTYKWRDVQISRDYYSNGHQGYTGSINAGTITLYLAGGIIYDYA